MTKLALTLSTLLFSLNSWAGMPADVGTYSGKGQLMRFSDGTNFEYKVKYTIGNGSITAEYVYPNGFSYTLPFTTVDTTLGQFNVLMMGQLAGNGYCIGKSCHVNVSFPLSGVLQSVSMEFTVLENKIIISGKNATTNTAFEDIVKNK